MFLENGRKVDAIGRGPRRIAKGGKEDVLFDGGGVGLDSLQDAGVKGMEKIAIAQKKANHPRAALQDAAGLSVRAETQALDGLQSAGTHFAAHLRAGIQHARNGSDADAGGARYIANGDAAWNCIHAFSIARRFRAFHGNRYGLDGLRCG